MVSTLEARKDHRLRERDRERERKSEKERENIVFVCERYGTGENER